MESEPLLLPKETGSLKKQSKKLPFTNLLANVPVPNTYFAQAFLEPPAHAPGHLPVQKREGVGVNLVSRVGTGLRIHYRTRYSAGLFRMISIAISFVVRIVKITLLSSAHP